tara:strand:+ start:3512 stop:3784 length:273 start_codon:yes stop_codon:yes gene_type:complete
MKLNLECSAADLYLIAKAFQQAEMQADRNMNASSQPRKRYRSTVSPAMNRKRQDTYEYQKELYGTLHDMFLDAIPQEGFKLSVEPEPSES